MVRCPVCGSEETKVNDTRHTRDYTRRRRECPEGHRFTTHEMVEGEPSGPPTISRERARAMAEDVEARILTMGRTRE